MRTTIDVPDPIYRRLKTLAAKEGRSIKGFILVAVEEALKPKTTSSATRVTLPLVKSTRPGTMQLDNAKIYEIIGFP